MNKNLFFTKFDDIVDNLEIPIPTEVVLPLDFDFVPNEIKSFANQIGSVYQSGQAFRNIFNTSISPQDIAQLAKNGLTSELTKLITENGLSSYLPVGVGFDKTRYSYRESEKKLNTKNLSLNFNPINIFQKFIERGLRGKSDDNDKAITDYYASLNTARRKIFDANTTLYATISSIIEVHQLHDLRQYSSKLEAVFSSNTVFDETLTIYQQLNNINNLLHEFTASHGTYLKFIKDKEKYLTYIETLDKLRVTFGTLVVQKELKYAYEDLKNLRRVTPETVFEPL